MMKTMTNDEIIETIEDDGNDEKGEQIMNKKDGNMRKMLEMMKHDGDDGK